MSAQMFLLEGLCSCISQEEIFFKKKFSDLVTKPCVSFCRCLELRAHADCVQTHAHTQLFTVPAGQVREKVNSESGLCFSRPCI